MRLSSFLQSQASNKPHILLLGNPVEHSLSPLMHNTALKQIGFDAEYFAVELQITEISTVINHFFSENFIGCNITIPYKREFMSALDRISDKANTVGAINTLYKTKHTLVGENTDIYGFTRPLLEYKDVIEGGRAIIFGTGGASRAVVQGCIEMGMDELVLVSRNPGLNRNQTNSPHVTVSGYDNWHQYAEEAVLIINSTPLGMSPEEESSPVRPEDADYLTGKICYDLVYNPLETKFLEIANKADAVAIAGLEMLIHQAAASFEYWTGSEFPIENVRPLVYEALSP